MSVRDTTPDETMTADDPTGPSGPDTPDLGPSDLGRARTDRITRRGFGLLGRGIKEQPLLFWISVLGSVLFGFMTVADARVLGWATDHVIRPSFAEGDVAEGALFTAIALFMAVAILRALGIVARRLIGGIVYYRLVAESRRQVTRQYLTLPMSWHHRHPTGQLLSNANADVEGAWAVFMPLPMAIGVIAMLVAAIVEMVRADLVLTLVGLVVFPALFVINVFYQRWLSPKVAHAQSLRGSVSAVAHESFDGAVVVKSLGREADETERFARGHRASCATPTSRSGASAACSTPCWRSCPTSASCWSSCWASDASAAVPPIRATSSRSRTCSRSSRSPSGPSAGCWVSSRAAS